ncbi:hypothetical protein NYO67_8965 [Aspergillus flavus]|nr:hypothetical protein NYO67_8965 [Aspergillus flavus]
MLWLLDFSLSLAAHPGLEVRTPGRNWPQGFDRRHPQLGARRLRAIDWKRDGQQTEDKFRHWFAIIGRELADPAIPLENVYNMHETGVLPRAPNSLKVIVHKGHLRNIEGLRGRLLHPLIIWSAATHRNAWTTHATPGRQFARSKTGYTNTSISLYWEEHV